MTRLTTHHPEVAANLSAGYTEDRAIPSVLGISVGPGPLPSSCNWRIRSSSSDGPRPV